MLNNFYTILEIRVTLTKHPYLTYGIYMCDIGQ